jgi:hypothetical protein
VPPKATITVRSGRHPHEIALLVMSFVSGMVGLAVQPATSPALASTLSGPLLNYFYLGLIVSSGASFVGALMNSVTGLLMERAGLILIVFLYVAYGVSVVSNSGIRGTTGALFGFAIAVASVVRIVQIQRDVKKVREWLREQPLLPPEKRPERLHGGD